MTEQDSLSDFPQDLPRSSGRPEQGYLRIPNRFAVHGPVPERLRARVVQELADGAISIMEGTPESALSSAGITPVYALGPGQSAAVPTGRVLVRFAPEDLADRHRDAIENAGYRIAEVLSYAPQAAWVEAIDASRASGLSGIPRLQELSGVVHLEPEMVRQGRRG